MPQKKELVGINGSGKSPKSADGNRLVKQGYKSIPAIGVETVTVPGMVAAWEDLLNSYGSQSLGPLLKPAIEYARNGFPVSEIIAYQWKRAEKVLLSNAEAAKKFRINGKPPKAGEIFSNKDLANTLELIGAQGCRVFYEGELAEKMCKSINKAGGSFTLEDFRNHKSEWVVPISTNYKGYDVYELPPNCQGAMVLEMLNILEGYDLQSIGFNSADYIHLLVEAKKIAFHDRSKYIADPNYERKLPTDILISKEYASRRRNEIKMDCTMPEVNDLIKSTDTSYVSVVDSERNCVSFICSIYSAFGSGLVVEDTGIMLQNRGTLFSLEPGHYNFLQPCKRPMHTIIPSMVLKDNKPWLCFGVMGGDMQPQGHVQILLNLIEFGMNVQEAGEAPRVCHTVEGVALETGIPWQTRLQLLEKGQHLISGANIFGGYQGIMIHPQTGMLSGGSDVRKDGCAMGY
jgi:gamma-glutamyltranspeptidase/glutathione hydrolase